jgi:hypothetical protein
MWIRFGAKKDHRVFYAEPATSVRHDPERALVNSDRFPENIIETGGYRLGSDAPERRPARLRAGVALVLENPLDTIGLQYQRVASMRFRPAAALAASLSALSFVPGAAAQDDEIVVTGSRISSYQSDTIPVVHLGAAPISW